MPALTLVASLVLSFFAYLTTAILVPRLGPTLISAGLKGIDLLKGDNIGGGGVGDVNPPNPSDVVKQNGLTKADGRTKALVVVDAPKRTGLEIPESTGLIAGGVYILALSLFAPVPFYAHFLTSSSSSVIPWLSLPGQTAFSSSSKEEAKDWGATFPHASLSTHLASMLSLLTAVFLGFLDDVFDIRWRFKLPIPIIASVPLLTAYAASLGGTDIVVPHILGLRGLLGVVSTGGVLKLGPFYYVYMSLLSTFCPNSINILAGINGVEVAQSLVIALSVVLNDILYLNIDLATLFPSLTGGKSWCVGFGLARGSRELEDRHLFSLYFMLPLVGVNLALLKFNRYPARSFVGDTFCYFAGMSFAVVGILGHFSKTLLLFFLPQIFNFLYSCPQLFGLVPIPRHRLPARDPQKDVLHPSKVLFVNPPKRRNRLALGVLEKCGLVRVERTREGHIKAATNLTLLNLVLVRRGPMREDQLTMWIVGLQVAGSAVAFGVRYGLAGLFYDSSRR